MIVEAPSLTPRSRRRAKNLEMILDKAMDLVILSGWEGFSVHRLAREVDYTPGALYRYFDSKDEIFSALVVRILKMLLGEIQTHVHLAPNDSLAQIMMAARSYKTFALQAPHRFGLMAMMMADPKELLLSENAARPVVGAMLETLKPLREVIENATTEGMLSSGNASQRTLTLFASLQGILQLRKLGEKVPHVFDVDTLFETLLDSVLMGWGVATKDIEQAHVFVNALEPLPSNWRSN